ncbi:hypothetical protein HR45_18375 [Shewanella mangrovi]|uniref:Glyoxalase-like domain-containing protein n=2 Tax=Shewanella mangrovi TaxID=1515746 RepID=A0A094JU94_9GAMM|nr:hypothetical protein HR45_18375 [Shewanella mangrovi]
MEIDHLFILCSPTAPEAEVLEAFGLQEGEPRVHQGQGTANRRFFFGNTYLELLYVQDELALQSDTSRITRLHERFGQHCSDISPFGICFKSLPSGDVELRDYRPDYLPHDYQLALAASNPLTEPMWFFLSSPEHKVPPYRTQQMLDSAGFSRLSAVIISTTQGASISAVAKTLVAESCVSLVPGLTPLMELIFDDGIQGRCHDFRPALPLVVNW